MFGISIKSATETVYNYLLMAITIACLSFTGIATVSAKGVQFNLLQSTPVGSWQLREDTTTDKRGRAEVGVMRTSLLGKEQRGGKDFYWVEMEMDTYKVSKKGKRKRSGDSTVMKVLISADAFSSDPGNIMMNLQGFGEEIIIQSGKEDPMRMTGAGGFMGGLMKAMGTKVNHDFTDLGNESVSVPAGEFNAKKIQGTGTTEVKVVFKTIRVESDSTAWMSSDVPFGIVKSEGTSTTNGKTSTHASELMEYGLSGAVSAITKEPKEMPEMPEMPNLGKLFGK